MICKKEKNCVSQQATVVKAKSDEILVLPHSAFKMMFEVIPHRWVVSRVVSRVVFRSLL